MQRAGSPALMVRAARRRRVGALWFLATDAGLGVLLHHAARVDRPLTADGDDPFQVAVEGDRNRGLGEACSSRTCSAESSLAWKTALSSASRLAKRRWTVVVRSTLPRRRRSPPSRCLGPRPAAGLRPEHSGEVACGVSSRRVWEILRPADTFGTKVNLLVAAHTENATHVAVMKNSPTVEWRDRAVTLGVRRNDEPTYEKRDTPCRGFG